MSSGAARSTTPGAAEADGRSAGPSTTRAAVLALPVPGAEPLDRVAGLALVTRTVLTLQKEGIARVLVVTDSTSLVPSIARDPRIRIPVEAVVVAATVSDLAPLAGLFYGPFLVARFEVVVDPAVYKLLLAAPLSGTLGAIAHTNGKPVGPFVATPALVDELGDEPLDEALARPDRQDRLAWVDVGSRWIARVTDDEGRRRATRELFEACRKPVDGYVARHLNRHISIFLSKLLVDTPVTPNGLSVFTFLLGIAAAVSAARGGWPATAAAGLLFQLNSILDGCDGELARVRFQHSRLGQWLDTVSDDLSNILFFAGLALGARALPYGDWLSSAGWVATGASVATTVVYYSELIQLGSGDLYAIEWGFDKERPAGIGGALLIFFRYLFKKDATVLLFCVLALVGILPYTLPIIAVAQIAILAAAVGRRVSRGAAAER